MKAIKITEELKDNNPKLFEGAVGDIVRVDVPKVFGKGDVIIFGYDTLTDMHEQDGFKNLVTPEYDTDVEKLGNIVESGLNYTYEVLALTDEEIKQRKENEAQSERLQKLEEEKTRQADEVFQNKTEVDEILENETAYPLWNNFDDGFSFEVDFKVRDFNIENELKVYKVIQAHNKQSDWKPKDVPALFVLVQAQGATEWEVGASYQIGDVRTYEGVEYRCIQAHTAVQGWQPPNVPSLWELNN